MLASDKGHADVVALPSCLGPFRSENRDVDLVWFDVVALLVKVPTIDINW
jgi:hypothetical protein